MLLWKCVSLRSIIINVRSKKLRKVRKRKIPLGPKWSFIIPPVSGAREGAMPIAIDNNPNIFTVSSFVEKSPIMALDRTNPAAEED